NGSMKSGKRKADRGNGGRRESGARKRGGGKAESGKRKEETGGRESSKRKRGKQGNGQDGEAKNLVVAGNSRRRELHLKSKDKDRANRHLARVENQLGSLHEDIANF